MGLPCMNCERNVESKDAKFFGNATEGVPSAAVFLCSECYSLAELFDSRAVGQLKSLLTLTRECIRVALLEKRLKLGALPPQRDLSKKEVFESLLQMLDKRDEMKPPS